MSSHISWLPGGRTANCLVRCECHGVRLMTVDEMRQHMREAHPVLHAGLYGEEGDGL